MPTAQIYIKRDFEDTWKSFKMICKREGSSISDKIMAEYVAPYVAIHRDGNPQTQLDFAGKPKTLPLWKTCKASNGKILEGQFYCRDCQDLKFPDVCEIRNRNAGCYKLVEGAIGVARGESA